MKKNNMIDDWLDEYGDPEIEKKVEMELKKIINDRFDKLKELGWSFRYDTYLTYWTKIDGLDLEVYVTKHITGDKWWCTLIEQEPNELHGIMVSTESEIPVNYDTTLEWLLDFVELLNKSGNNNKN